jgi:hydrogenase maturation factor HypF (carbamoyltransferase family)
MSKRVSQIIITPDEPRRNPGTDLWFNPDNGRLYYWSMSNGSWTTAISGGAPSSSSSSTEDSGQSSQLSTTDIVEGTKLFYTNQRVTDLADLYYLKLTQASAEYLNRVDASATYLSIVEGLSKAQASAIYTPLTTFNTQLVSAFAALESLSESLAGFDGDLATALEAIYLKQTDASETYATKVELENSLLELDAAAVVYGIAL